MKKARVQACKHFHDDKRLIFLTIPIMEPSNNAPSAPSTFERAIAERQLHAKGPESVPEAKLSERAETGPASRSGDLPDSLRDVREEALAVPTSPALRALIASTTERIRADLAVSSPAQLEAYLQVVARFPRFSLYNQHLLFAQYPEAVILGEFEAWSAHGYLIKRGSRAIRLISGRAVLLVFDIGQTSARADAVPLPTFRPEKQTPYAIYDKLTTHLLSIGAIDPEYLTDVTPESDPEAILEEIEYFARGYADYLLQQSAFPRIAPERIKDCHVEAIAYVALQHLGIESVYPANDLEKWGKTPEALREELELVRRIAVMMIAELATYQDAQTRGRRLRHVHYALE